MTVPMDVDGDAHAHASSSGHHAAVAAPLDDVLLGGDPSKLNQPIKKVEDKFQLLPAFLKVRGLVKQVLTTGR